MASTCPVDFSNNGKKKKINNYNDTDIIHVKNTTAI